MRAVVFTPMAADDLKRIFDYIQERNPPAAHRIIDRVEAVLPRLALMPGTGHRRSDVADPRYRFWVVRPLLIAYRYDEDALTVIRVVHGSRDVRSVLSPRT